MAGRRFLLLRADIARPLLRERLVAAGADVRDVAIYETRPVEQVPADLLTVLDAGTTDWVTFTSSSTVRNFLSLVGGASLGRAKLASIGPVTTRTLREAGLTPAVEATTFNLNGLIEAVLAHASVQR